jgi:hypothetical protein
MLLEALFREPSQNVLCLACIVYLSSTDVATVALIVLGIGIDRCVLSNSQLGRFPCHEGSFNVKTPHQATRHWHCCSVFRNAMSCCFSTSRVDFGEMRRAAPRLWLVAYNA